MLVSCIQECQRQAQDDCVSKKQTKQVHVVEVCDGLVYSSEKAQYYIKLAIFEGNGSGCLTFYEYVHE